MSIAPPPSRNDPCPCGSGRRYKQCHGAMFATGTPARADVLDELLRRAIALHRQNRYVEAGRLYDEALALSPDLPDALHMRGAVDLSLGDAAAAIRRIEQALAAGLDTPAARHNLELARELALDIAAEPARRRAMDEAARRVRQPDDVYVPPSDVELLAFLLPQFHRIDENDEWWGLGFTEWTNVRRAEPNFPGHGQPHVPADLGYYDLLDPDVRMRQAELARSHGITGFCYYYYWFEGRRLLEQPLDAVLASGSPAFPFCVFWANEDWRRTWDGGRNEVLVAQRYSQEDDRAFIRTLLPAFRDPRYIRVLGQPLLLVYRCDTLPDAIRTFDTWRAVCIEAGEMPPFIVKADTTGGGTPLEVGADASVAFPPHRLESPLLRADPPPGLRPDFEGRLYDARSVSARAACAPEPDHLHFQTVVPMWDNTPRRQRDGTIFLNASPAVFRASLRDCFMRARTMLPPGQRFVFVNAWNEWAEGAYLEPDIAHGRAYLEAAMEARHLPADGERIADVVARLMRG
ncbi:MAG: glycoside hydrolase family 99-like domain-containing protein [Burkholderiales bacterium]|nr:glycoside hydrolase family 99-like domain-containing protein [Burkholderiales bacterium]